MEKNFNFLIYRSADENVSVNALIKDETIWLNQKAMAELFGCSTDNISSHLKNIFADGELDETLTTEEFSIVQNEGNRQVKRKNKFYNKEIRQLERAVTGYFDYIEDLIERENTFTMEQFASSVNEFLAFRKYDIL